MPDDAATTETETEHEDAGTDTGAPPPKPEDEVAKWKAMARKHEAKAKENATAAKELASLRESMMTDQEKAIEAAKAEARSDALRTVGARLVAAEVRAIMAGRNVNVDALLKAVDASKFLDKDGEPDTKAIKEWADSIAQPPPADLGQGAGRGTHSSGGDDMNALIRRKFHR